MSKVTFGKPESYHQGWKGKTTKFDVKFDGKVVGEVVGRENAAIAGCMHWHVELKGKRSEEVSSMKDAREKARALLEPAPPSSVFEVYRNGLCYMSVCTDMKPEEAAQYANACNPPGTKNGWSLSKDKTFRTGEPHPFPCPDHKGRLHLLFEC